jgi:hypothetical protein
MAPFGRLIMPLPRFIDIDGRRYLWRDLIALRQAQAQLRAEQPTLFELHEDHRPLGTGIAPSLPRNFAASGVPGTALLSHESTKTRKQAIPCSTRRRRGRKRTARPSPRQRQVRHGVEGGSRAPCILYVGTGGARNHAVRGYCASMASKPRSRPLKRRSTVALPLPCSLL